jgi:hypothetical protein
MRARPVLIGLIFPLLAGASSACSGPASGPVATTLGVGLESPYRDDGAVLFTVTGGRVDSVETPGYTLYTSRPDANTLQVIVTGNVSSGAIARLHLPDERLVSRYAATVNQAAARGSYTQRDPAGYRLTLAP